MNTDHTIPANNSGFTLVELMVALVVAFLVIAAVYASYVVQQRTQIEQQQVTQMQQNLRAALDMMTREFKMAGYDPTQSGEYDIKIANATTFAFEADLCEDGGLAKPVTTSLCPGVAPSEEQPNAGRQLDETYTFQLFDSNADGINDALQRVPATAAPPVLPIPIAENIEQIEFSYIMDNGSEQGQVTGVGNLANIRAVQIAVLARADQPDYRYTNQQTYTTLFGTPDWDDPADFAVPTGNSLNYRRRILLATIELRNMGLL